MLSNLSVDKEFFHDKIRGVCVAHVMYHALSLALDVTIICMHRKIRCVVTQKSLTKFCHSIAAWLDPDLYFCNFDYEILCAHSMFYCTLLSFVQYLFNRFFHGRWQNPGSKTPGFVPPFDETHSEPPRFYPKIHIKAVPRPFLFLLFAVPDSCGHLANNIIPGDIFKAYAVIAENDILLIFYVDHSVQHIYPVCIIAPCIRFPV